MKNFNPDGYSVPEVAQILGCTPATIRSYINKGLLKANMSNAVVEKGHKRRIRISRKQLVDYMSTKKDLYSESEIFMKLCAAKTEKEEVQESEYTVSDISELTGAWAPENLSDNKQVTTKTDNKKENRYVLLVDGRISIGNVKRDTIQHIVSALLSDDSFSPKELTIKFD